MNTPYILLVASAALIGGLGCIHLAYTYRGNKLDPRDPAVRTAMERTNLVITRQTTVWRATKGFNASHSLGLMLFGAVYGYLALRRPEVLSDSPYLLVVGMAALLAYLALARRYFFRTPFRGVALACALYAGGWALLA